jgi:hypothetical protein
MTIIIGILKVIGYIIAFVATAVILLIDADFFDNIEKAKLKRFKEQKKLDKVRSEYAAARG